MEEKRVLAKADGHKTYISDYPCPSKHTPSKRYTINGQCVECKNTARNERRPKLTSAIRASLAKNAHYENLKQKINLWRTGKFTPSTNRTLKPMLAFVYGNKCDTCGIDSWNYKEIVLEVEHKDGNSENNSYGNVCLICPNCHSQTPTYKGANRGNGRHYRRVRYKEGKSY